MRLLDELRRLWTPEEVDELRAELAADEAGKAAARAQAEAEARAKVEAQQVASVVVTREQRAAVVAAYAAGGTERGIAGNLGMPRAVVRRVLAEYVEHIAAAAEP